MSCFDMLRAQSRAIIALPDGIMNACEKLRILATMSIHKMKMTWTIHN